MGLSNKSTGSHLLQKGFGIRKTNPSDIVVALAGNPNTGKSTVFNMLTGLNQHTGNWPGKTVTNAQGKYNHNGDDFIAADLPGTYSLIANSAEEEVARDFICFGKPDVTVVVTDATCLARNLNLVLQIMEITSRVVLCVNLMDEAKKKKIAVDRDKLSSLLGIPVVCTSARSGEGLDELKDIIQKVANGKLLPAPVKINYGLPIETAISILKPSVEKAVKGKLRSEWVSLRLLEGDDTLIKSLQQYPDYAPEPDHALKDRLKAAVDYLQSAGITNALLKDKIVSTLISTAETICKEAIHFGNSKYDSRDRKIDSILISGAFGIPVMIILLAAVMWLTITGANYPSALLASLFFSFESYLTTFFARLAAPEWVHGILVLGMYRTLAWVVSVMLPPMAIFFPLFTLLEDMGYLPRVAFNLDNFFKKACAHGKQALTMCMGFGCNAAGVVGCRIIDSPRERLIAIITNNFVPCNGRFPALIAIITMFFTGLSATASSNFLQSLLSSLFLTGIIVLGIVMTFFTSRVLTRTVLKGHFSSFSLELPPYRRPQIGKVIVRSLFDRTLFVLARAVTVAAPAGIILWIMGNISIYDLSILEHCAAFLNPFAWLLGMDGYILMAFILGFPANEIVVPIIIMSYMATGIIQETGSLTQIRELLISRGWTWLTAVCVMLFTLMHWPCGTTCLIIKKETQSWKWTFVSFLLPTITGMIVCFLVAAFARMFGLAP